MINRIGQMDSRITLQRGTDSIDAQGSVSQTWATVASAWAKAEQVAATEATAGNERTAQQDYRFTIRHQDILTGLAPADRIVWGGLNFDIISATPSPPERPDQIVITARRRA